MIFWFWRVWYGLFVVRLLYMKYRKWIYRIIFCLIFFPSLYYNHIELCYLSYEPVWVNPDMSECIILLCIILIPLFVKYDLGFTYTLDVKQWDSVFCLLGVFWSVLLCQVLISASWKHKKYNAGHLPHLFTV